MATVGPNSPSAVSVVSPGFAGTWADPTYIYADDSNYAVHDEKTPSAPSLRCTGFGFAIPAGATIDGILVELKCYTNVPSGNAVFDYCSAIKAGTPVPTYYMGAVAIPTTEQYVSYGGASNLLGTTWTAEDINSSDFGVMVSAAHYDDGQTYFNHVRITVYYTPAPPAGGILAWFQRKVAEVADIFRLPVPFPAYALQTATATR